MELSKEELAALDACLEVAGEGPEEVVEVALRAMRKLKDPHSADTAARFHAHILDFWDDDAGKILQNEDFQKGVMFHWLITQTPCADYETAEDVLARVDAAYPFFLDIIS